MLIHMMCTHINHTRCSQDFKHVANGLSERTAMTPILLVIAASSILLYSARGVIISTASSGITQLLHTRK